GRDAIAVAGRSRPGRASQAPARAPPAVPAARNDPWPDSDVEGFAAAAAALLVRVPEHKTRLQLLLGIVHLSADQEQRRLGIDHELDALGVDDLVQRLLLVGKFERVAEARAALGAHADANARSRLAAAVDQRLDALGGGRRHRHHLRARTAHPRSGRRRGLGSFGRRAHYALTYSAAEA